jgi:internalin A
MQPAFPGQAGDKSPTFPGKGPVDPSPLAPTNNGHISPFPVTAESQLEPSPTPQIFPTKTLKVFLSYSHSDKAMRVKLEKYLSHLKRQHSISSWHDGEIGAGNEWAKEIDTHLSQANIVLLLVSQDFIASDYCHEIEMKRALERHKRGEACVIPIILRPAHWEVTPLRELQVLPTGGRPITRWPNRDAAFLDVAVGIQKIVDRLTGNNTPG